MEEIREYLVSLEMPEKAVEQKMAKFEQNPDIAQEFAEWIKAGAQEYPDGISVEGHTAKKIKELALFMNGAGVYDFLISLRENPEECLRYIAEGFPIG